MITPLFCETYSLPIATALANYILQVHAYVTGMS